MSKAMAALALAASSDSPFITQRCIQQIAIESEIETQPYLAFKPDMMNHIKSMWASHNALYGVCDLHVDTLYSEELRRTGWWSRRKLRKIEKQWKTGLWLALTIEAEQFMKNVEGNEFYH